VEIIYQAAKSRTVVHVHVIGEEFDKKTCQSAVAKKLGKMESQVLQTFATKATVSTSK